MHYNSICHRDLKLDNIIFGSEKNNFINIIDFGLSRDTMEGDMKSYLGTPYYVAPEILKKKPYNKQCDIWSLGVCMFKIMTGEYPF